MLFKVLLILFIQNTVFWRVSSCPDKNVQSLPKNLFLSYVVSQSYVTMIIYVSVYTSPPTWHDALWHLFFFVTLALILCTIRLNLGGEQVSKNLGATLNFCAAEGWFEESIHTCGPEKMRLTIEYLLVARCDAVGYGTALQGGRLRVRFPLASLDFFYWHIPSGHIMVLGSTQPLTEMSKM